MEDLLIDKQSVMEGLAPLNDETDSVMEHLITDSMMKQIQSWNT